MFHRLYITVVLAALLPVLAVGWLIYNSHRSNIETTLALREKVAPTAAVTASPPKAALTAEKCSDVASQLSNLNEKRLIVREGDVPDPLLADLDHCLDRGIMNAQVREKLIEIGILRNIGRLKT